MNTPLRTMFVLLTLSLPLYAQPEKRDSTLDRVQRDADRGTGYVEPAPNYELDRIYENRDPRTAPEVLERLERDRDRQQRLGAQSRHTVSTDNPAPNTIPERTYRALTTIQENPALLELRKQLRNWVAQRDIDLAAAPDEPTRQQIRKAYDLHLTEILLEYTLPAHPPSTNPTTQPIP